MDKLLKSYTSFYGKPDLVFHFNANAQKTSQFPLDILVYDAIEAEDLFTTAFCTSGLSKACLVSNEAEYPSELIIELAGKQTNAHRKRIAESLAVSLSNKLSSSACLLPEEIYEMKFFPFAENMTHFFLMDWGVTTADFLPETDPPVRLLRIVPLFTEEAENLSEIPCGERTELLASALTSRWDNPKREVVNFAETAIQSVWGKIDKWYEDNAPRVFTELNNGVPSSQIASFIKATGLTLPRDFQASLKIHDGEVQFHDYRYLSLSQIHARWTELKQLSTTGSIHWQSEHVPFAEDSKGNLICINCGALNNGQILYWEMNEGAAYTGHASFFSWLKAYKDSLYQGGLEVDSDGYLAPRI